MIIREQNMAEIEKVNQNLGTALGWKYTGGVQTQHPAVIVFVPDKVRASKGPRNSVVRYPTSHAECFWL